MLQAIEKPFYLISVFVEFFVECSRKPPIALGRNYNGHLGIEF